MRVAGLDDDQQRIVNGLVKTIDDKLPRNILRDNYMDHQVTLDRFGIMQAVPERFRVVVGWPAKAVEALARRCNLEGFSTTSGDLEALGINDLVEDNQFLREAPQGHISSLVHSCAFQVVTAGEDGEPEQLITRVTARDGSGEWDGRQRRLTSFLSVLGRDETDGKPSDMNLYLPDQVISILKRSVVERQAQPLGRVPVEPLVYRPRLGRPFGSSRISRPVMSLTQSALRVILRSESTADIYSAPGLIAFGLTSEQLTQGSWVQGIGNVVGIPDAGDAPETSLARAQVQVIQQASQEPHISQLRAWAQLFAGETNIPASSLGVSVDQANPESAEAYAASREDLIAEAEDADREWGAAHVRTLQMAWALREGVTMDELPDEVRNLRARWRDPRHVSQAAAADAFTKLVGVLPGLAQSDAALDMLGLGEDLTARIRADLTRQRGRAVLDGLGALPDAVAG